MQTRENIRVKIFQQKQHITCRQEQVSNLPLRAGGRVALVLTPEGFPVAYEVYPGNTRDSATLGKFLDRIE